MQVLLINLDRSVDRLAFMQAQITRLGMRSERIAAIDGAKVVLPVRELVDEKAFNWRHHAILRRGEIGCYLSHVSAVNRFLGSGEAAALILEDDVELSPDVPGVLNALAACPDEWDLVKLHATHPGGVIDRCRLDQNYRLVSLAFRHGSAAAYVVNRKAALKLSAGLLPMTVPYDHEYERAWKYGLKLRTVLPLPTSRHLFPSTIANTNPVDAAARAVNARMHKPWYAQGGMVLFRGANDLSRVIHELRQG